MAEYYIIRSTDENGDPVPIEQNKPLYMRCGESGMNVEWSNGPVLDWKKSILLTRADYLEDVLVSGASVRMLTDEEVAAL